MTVAQGNIITIVEETEGWEDWKDVTIIWPNGQIDLRTFVDGDKVEEDTEEEDDDDLKDNVYLTPFNVQTAVNWAIDYARYVHHTISVNVVIGTYYN